MNVLLMLLWKYVTKLGLQAQGFLGFMGLAKEVTWGTPVVATDFMEILSENLATQLERFTVKNAFGGFYEPDDVIGVRRVVGDISAWGHPSVLGHLLRAVFNNCSNTSILSGFLYRSNFSTTKSEFAVGVPTQPYTLEIFRDTVSSFQFSGALCSRLELALATNQDIRATANWIAKAPGTVAKSVPTFVSSPIAPFTFDSCSISIGGSAYSRMEAFKLTIDNNMEGIPGLLNSRDIAKVRRRDVQMYALSGTIDFLDHAEYDDFLAQTERRMVLNMFQPNSFNLTIDLPRFVYSAFPLGIGGRERLTASFEGKARFNVGSGLAVDIGLTSTKSNW